MELSIFLLLGITGILLLITGKYIEGKYESYYSYSGAIILLILGLIVLNNPITITTGEQITYDQDSNYTLKDYQITYLREPINTTQNYVLSFLTMLIGLFSIITYSASLYNKMYKVDYDDEKYF